jgi:PBP1b-binding outer membrane lipoprotein LpoB
MRRNRLIDSLLGAALLLAGCSSAGQQNGAQTQAVATMAMTEKGPGPAPTDTSVPAGQKEAPVSQETGTSQPATTEPAAMPQATATATAEPTAIPEAPATATTSPQFNGEYEDTFYRGSATAPITMIDYSDFL